jgi:26S proteasome non-ATPase regulatory subunit 9
MDDIHTPSVASGPTSSGHSNGVAKENMTLKQLTDEKDRLEGELSALSAVLDSVRLSPCSCVRAMLMASSIKSI